MNLKLMVLVDPGFLAEKRLGAFCREIAKGGATVVQLRDKKSGTRTLIRYGRALRGATRREGLELVVNDRVDVALAVQADGIHVGQDDMAVQDVRRLAPRPYVGLSVRDVGEMPQGPDIPDYFGVGPVFPTGSKPDAGADIGIEGLHEMVQRLRSIAPVVAIGGITGANAEAVWKAGVDGLAVISSVRDAIDVQEAVRQLIETRGWKGDI